MKLIAITCEALFDSEAEVLDALFAEGLELLHIRKPASTEEDMRRLLGDVGGRFRDRIVLHDHLCLAAEFGLRGIHLNGRNPDRPPCSTSLTVSRSCHSPEEVVSAMTGDYDYVFLSPVFDSISKRGYRGAFSDRQLRDIASRRVVALGGVDATTIPLAARLGFGGVAVLGALWGDNPGDKGAVSERFGILRKECEIINIYS